MGHVTFCQTRPSAGFNNPGEHQGGVYRWRAYHNIPTVMLVDTQRQHTVFVSIQDMCPCTPSQNMEVMHEV